jgi:hypothetical protein
MMRKGKRTRVGCFDPNEKALLEKEGSENQPVPTFGLLIFSLGFCALVFQAGWEERLAYDQCGGLGRCSALIASPPAP